MADNRELQERIEKVANTEKRLETLGLSRWDRDNDIRTKVLAAQSGVPQNFTRDIGNTIEKLELVKKVFENIGTGEPA